MSAEQATAEPTPKQRGPYRGRDARLSYDERLALREIPRPECKCGCGTLTRWLSGKTRWAAYADGHYRQASPHRDPAWLRQQYVDHRRTVREIADECGVHVSAVLKQMRKHGIPRRDRSESRMGRKVGARNPAWKGGVAQWEYAPDWKAIARQIRERDDWTCQRCGEQRKRWGRSLHVHHIDGNKLNNEATNLIALCAGCHRGVHRGEVI